MFDVDAMVEALTPHQFDEWLAYRRIVPDPFERLIEVCKRGFTILANSWGCKITPDDLDPMEQEKPVATAEQTTAILTAALGSGKHVDGNR